MVGRKLDFLFLDMNAYFASVEQQLRPELRGRPTVVVPVDADTTCCIAASYEAKRLGIKTGTKVGAAKELCPDLNIVESRPVEYIKYHKKIVDAVGTVIPVDKVSSIDEMVCVLMGREREYENAVSIGRRVKKAIKELAGEHLRCSVGLATNRFISKVATEMEKPDGFVIVTKEELPEKLYSLELTDLPGIGRGMHARLRSRGIYTVKDLCALTQEQCRGIWKSVIGKRWWYYLRGEDISEIPTKRRTVGHSHVLPPEMRSDAATRGVMVRLIHKAAFRLRRLRYLAGQMEFHVRYFNRKDTWKTAVKIGRRSDTQSMINAFSSVWEGRPRGYTPLSLSVTLFDLVAVNESALPLFPDELKREKIASALDKINERFGANSIYYASMHGAEESAPMRISFTSIPDILAESEGKGGRRPQADYF